MEKSVDVHYWTVIARIGEHNHTFRQTTTSIEEAVQLTKDEIKKNFRTNNYKIRLAAEHGYIAKWR